MTVKELKAFRAKLVHAMYLSRELDWDYLSVPCYDAGIDPACYQDASRWFHAGRTIEEKMSIFSKSIAAIDARINEATP